MNGILEASWGAFAAGGIFGLAALLGQGVVDPSASGFAAPAGRSRVEGDSFPRTLVDRWGNRTVLPAPARRVVSTSLMTDEIVLEMLPAGRIAAVGPFSADPEYSNVADAARDVPKTGLSMSVEKILSLTPDLVLAARFNRQEEVAMLVASGVPVARIDRYESLADIRDNLLLVGRLTGEEARAADLVRGMEEVVDAVRRRVGGARERPKVLYWLSGGWTMGADTLVDEFIRIAGGVNVAAEAGMEGLRPIALEAVFAADPEVILTVGRNTDLRVAPATDPLRALGGGAFRGVRAVKNGRVWAIPARHTDSVSHHVAKSAEDFARAIHPERFR